MCAQTKKRALEELVEAQVRESEIMNKKVVAVEQQEDREDDPVGKDATQDQGDLQIQVEKDLDIREIIKEQYKDNPVFAKVLDKPDHHKRFVIRDKLIFTDNKDGQEVLCILHSTKAEQIATAILIENAHVVLGHFGAQKTVHYIRCWYWWPTMTKDIKAFCESCENCQMMKGNSVKPAGLLHSLLIPRAPWNSVAMDFVGPFPLCEGFDYLLVVIDQLTLMVRLIPTTTKVKASGVAALYLREVVKLHGVPETIVSDCDPKFMSKFWRELHRLIGTKLLLSTAFHLQTDGQTECSMRTIGQILRALVDSDQKNWATMCPMVEFAINSAMNKTTGFAPFKLVYSNMPCIIPDTLLYTQFKGVKAFTDQAAWNISAVHNAIIAKCVFQTHTANKKC
jgi:hypothetical protein